MPFFTSAPFCIGIDKKNFHFLQESLEEVVAWKPDSIKMDYDKPKGIALPEGIVTTESNLSKL